MEQLIDDPRARARTAAAPERIKIRDGTGATAQKLCLLCVEPPCGGNPQAWRRECPGHTARDYVQAEQARLKQPVRRPKVSGAD